MSKAYTTLTRTARMYGSDGLLTKSGVSVIHIPATSSRVELYAINGTEHRADDLTREQDGKRITLTSKLAGWEVVWESKK